MIYHLYYVTIFTLFYVQFSYSSPVYDKPMRSHAYRFIRRSKFNVTKQEGENTQRLTVIKTCVALIGLCLDTSGHRTPSSIMGIIAQTYIDSDHRRQFEHCRRHCLPSDRIWLVQTPTGDWRRDSSRS